MRWKEIFRQIHLIGNQSLFIIVLSVSFAAMVTILESSFHMKLLIQNDSLVPGFAAMLIFKELGAVITALLLTSRVGAGMTAEIGTMKITEQIDALKMLGIDPFKYLVIPRWVAMILSALFLTLIANIICLICAMLVSQFYLGLTQGLFLAAMNRFLHFEDLLQACSKAICFGAVIPLISCFWGFRCESGAEGVGRATTNSVVSSSIAIILIDFVLSSVFS